MTTEQQVAWIFLAYLLAPVAFFLVWWLVGFLRRKLFKKGGGEETGAEGEA